VPRCRKGHLAQLPAQCIGYRLVLRNVRVRHGALLLDARTALVISRPGEGWRGSKARPPQVVEAADRVAAATTSSARSSAASAAAVVQAQEAGDDDDDGDEVEMLSSPEPLQARVMIDLDELDDFGDEQSDEEQPPKVDVVDLTDSPPSRREAVSTKGSADRGEAARGLYSIIGIDFQFFSEGEEPWITVTTVKGQESSPEMMRLTSEVAATLASVDPDTWSRASRFLFNIKDRLRASPLVSQLLSGASTFRGTFGRSASSTGPVVHSVHHVGSAAPHDVQLTSG
jgi:hypothetical protein